MLQDQGIHLVLHERQEWGNDNGDASRDNSWQLITKTLPCTSVKADQFLPRVKQG